MSAREIAFRFAISVYVGEPCRLCGDPIRSEDVHTMVWIGYDDVKPGRAGHKPCWDALPEDEKQRLIAKGEAVRAARGGKP